MSLAPVYLLFLISALLLFQVFICTPQSGEAFKSLSLGMARQRISFYISPSLSRIIPKTNERRCLGPTYDDCVDDNNDDDSDDGVRVVDDGWGSCRGWALESLANVASAGGGGGAMMSSVIMANNGTRARHGTRALEWDWHGMRCSAILLLLLLLYCDQHLHRGSMVVVDVEEAPRIFIGFSPRYCRGGRSIRWTRLQFIPSSFCPHDNILEHSLTTQIHFVLLHYSRWQFLSWPVDGNNGKIIFGRRLLFNCWYCNGSIS